MQTIGERVRALRIMRGMKQATLAKAAGIKPPSLSQIETGRTKTLKASTILRIAAALDTNPSFLMSGTGSPEMADAPNPNDEEVMEVMRGMTAKQRAALLAVAHVLASESD